MHSDSVKNLSAYADQNHAPSLAAARLEFIKNFVLWNKHNKQERNVRKMAILSASMISLVWLILLGILLVIEIITLGLTTIWFAGGALIAFLVAILGGAVWLQVVVFLAVSMLLLIFTRPIAMKYMSKNVQKTNVDSLEGEIAVVIQTIDNLKGTGQVVIRGMEWSAKTREDKVIKEGTVVKVITVEGVKVVVEEEK